VLTDFTEENQEDTPLAVREANVHLAISSEEARRTPELYSIYSGAIQECKT
jgi:hypothetical protein